MKKTALVVMAAGIGSRFGGGIKQLEPVGPSGEIIMDYSIHDALEAGFNKVVFIIRKDLEKDFREIIGNRIEKLTEVAYAFQEVENLPGGFKNPEGRTKPWGTGQAVLSCKGLLNEPFVVINADDYYGPEAYQLIYDYLCAHPDGDVYEYVMVGYLLKNTVTEHGSVARGVCTVDGEHILRDIVERTAIEKDGADARFTEDGGQSWTPLPGNTTVSMNMWGFTRSFLDEALARFPAFLDKALAENPAKAEYFLPTVVEQLIGEDKARVRVLVSEDKWYGVTYREDKPTVVAAIAEKTKAGLYPDQLWEA